MRLFELLPGRPIVSGGLRHQAARGEQAHRRARGGGAGKGGYPRRDHRQKGATARGPTKAIWIGFESAAISSWHRGDDTLRKRFIARTCKPAMSLVPAGASMRIRTSTRSFVTASSSRPKLETSASFACRRRRARSSSISPSRSAPASPRCSAATGMAQTIRTKTSCSSDGVSAREHGAVACQRATSTARARHRQGPRRGGCRPGRYPALGRTAGGQTGHEGVELGASLTRRRCRIGVETALAGVVDGARGGLGTAGTFEAGLAGVIGARQPARGLGRARLVAGALGGTGAGGVAQAGVDLLKEREPGGLDDAAVVDAGRRRAGAPAVQIGRAVAIVEALDLRLRGIPAR
jgi:hypothetical protein